VKLFALIAGLASMKAAIDRHDVDEAARQGTLAGPAVVLEALRDHDRTAQLAGIAAAPRVEDRAELLARLAAVAAGADRRTAIPAARAARQIARELGAQSPHDDLAGEELGAWHDAWLALAARRDRWIELRVVALDVAAALGDVPLSSDPDPAIRRAAIELQPTPTPRRAELVAVVATDADDRVALAAAGVLCLDGTFDALDATGKQRLAALAYRCP